MKTRSIQTLLLAATLGLLVTACNNEFRPDSGHHQAHQREALAHHHRHQYPHQPRRHRRHRVR